MVKVAPYLYFPYDGPCNETTLIDLSRHGWFSVVSPNSEDEPECLLEPPKLYEINKPEDMSLYQRENVMAFCMYLRLFFVVAPATRVVAMQEDNKETKLVLFLGHYPFDDKDKGCFYGFYNRLFHLICQYRIYRCWVKHYDVENPLCPVSKWRTIREQFTRPVHGIDDYVRAHETYFRKICSGLPLPKRTLDKYIKVVTDAIHEAVYIAYLEEKLNEVEEQEGPKSKLIKGTSIYLFGYLKDFSGRVYSHEKVVSQHVSMFRQLLFKSSGQKKITDY